MLAAAELFQASFPFTVTLTADDKCPTWTRLGSQGAQTSRRRWPGKWQKSQTCWCPGNCPSQGWTALRTLSFSLSPCVSVPLSCCNQNTLHMAETYFLQLVLQARRSQVLGDGTFHVWWGPIPDSRKLLLLCLHIEKGRGSSLGSFFIKALIPLMGLPPLWPSHLVQDMPPKTITSWRGVVMSFQYINFGDTNSS